MERRIGEVFTYNDKTYQVVKSIVCTHCAFRGKLCGLIEPSAGNCMPSNRSDKTSVIFKEVNNMEIKNNQLTIDIPEGMEIDLENSDLAKGVVKFKPKSLTYEDISQALLTDYGSLVVPNRNIPKLLAISKLMDIAKYYNKDWRPNWECREIKYYIYFDNNSNEYNINYNDAFCRNTIYFKNSKDAKAIIDNPNLREILDTVYKN